MIDGTCGACPPDSPVITDPGSILQTATLTWGIKQTFINDQTQFYIDFSEDDIFFLENMDLTNLKLYLTVNHKKLTSRQNWKGSQNPQTTSASSSGKQQ
jgi:hypothetical protein